MSKTTGKSHSCFYRGFLPDCFSFLTFLLPQIPLSLSNQTNVEKETTMRKENEKKTIRKKQ